MKILRHAALASLLVWMWAILFSFAAATGVLAQEDQVSQPQSPNDAGVYDQSASGGPNGASGQPDLSNQSNQSNQNDPPGRAARLQYMSGSVSIQPRGTEDWVQGSVNRPLTIADNVWADKNSRAELNVGTGLIRIGSETSLTLTNVNDSSVQLSLHQGAMNLHVRHLYRGEIYEVDTPNQAFTILKTGDYRFDVDPNADSTVVTVWRGEGEATGQGPSVRVKEHQQARFNGGDSLAHEIHSAPQPDGFDDWCLVRNRREDQSISARYVSPDVIGSEDLDDYGTWRSTPEYGHVWVPTRVDREWAPYSSGHWIYEEPWGWTWVDDAPWGFAPFHYGRWVSFDGNWGWAPGPYYGGWNRGWYAPALVAWFGGPGWGVSFGYGGGFGFGGGYGWCPLGWGEPFRPWYQAGWGYFRNVNNYNTRIVNINNYRNTYVNGRFANGGGLHYANMNVRGGFTAVPRGTLERGLSVRQNAVRISANDVRSAPAIGRVNANPTLQSRLGPNAGRPAASAPASAISRPVISRITPPARSSVAGTTAGAGTRMGTFGSSRLGMNQASTIPSPGGGVATGTRIGKTNAGVASSSTRGMATPTAVAGGRSIPRPPQSFGRSNSAVGGNGSVSSTVRGPNNSMSGGRNVPRPPSAGGTSMRAEPMRTATSQGTSNMNRSSDSVGRGSFGGSSVGSSVGRSVPRPSGGTVQGRVNSSENRGAAIPQPSTGNWSRTGSAPTGAGNHSVPRPTGQIAPAPRNYSSGGNAPRYSSPSYSRSYPSSGNSPNYSTRIYNQGSARDYGSSPQYGGFRNSAPSYGGRSSGGPSYGGSRSAPAASGRSYGGGSYGGGSSSAPSHGSSGGEGSRGGSGGGSGGSSSGSGHSGGHR